MASEKVKTFTDSNFDTEIKSGILLFWLLPLLPSVFSDAAPHAMRALGAVPAVCLITAVGISSVIDLPTSEPGSSPNIRSTAGLA